MRTSSILAMALLVWSRVLSAPPEMIPVTEHNGASYIAGGELVRAAGKAALETKVAASPDDWQSRVALANLLASEGRHGEALRQLEAAAPIRPRDSSIYFAWGLTLLKQGDQAAALAKLKQARDFDPDNWRIRKQNWAIEHPDKFYTANSPDYDWQKEQLAREKEQPGR